MVEYDDLKSYYDQNDILVDYCTEIGKPLGVLPQK